LKPRTIVRILQDRYLATGLRENYWNTRHLAAELAGLFRSENAAFRRHALRDQVQYLLDTVQPVAGETSARARAAVDWLLRAQGASGNAGVSLGYFPCSEDGSAWRPSYPETTGYIITSLLSFAERFGDDAVRSAALDMAHWEVEIQMDSGAVQGGPLCAPELRKPAAFNTGMVLDGWCSAYAAAKDATLLAAARRAADFLVDDLDANGYFRTNGPFVSSGEIKTYTCLCAWAMYRLGEITGEARYAQAALRSIDAALRQQQPNGWFAHNCLARSDAPLTHTIGYTLQGILEVGIASGRQDLVAAVRRSVDALIPRITGRGYLWGMFYADWEPAGLSSCLTGSAQVSVVCYRLYEHSGAQPYFDAAERLLNYLKALQAMTSSYPAVDGALAGSFPLFGEYMRAGYPNWATKYLLDALMLQERLGERRATIDCNSGVCR